MDNKEPFTEPAEDSTEALIKEYDKKRKNKADDVIAAQAVLCILLSAALFFAQLLRPDIAEAVLGRFRSLTEDRSFVVPNLIDLVLDCIDKL